MPNVRRCLIVAAVSVALSGCPSLSMLSRPRTVPRGEQEVAVAVAYDAVGAPYLAKNGGQLEIGYRRGLGERTDLGLKVSLLGAQGDLKYQLLRSERLDLSVSPALGFSLSGQAFAGFLHLTIPVGWNPTDGISVILAPRISGQLGLATGSACNSEAFCPFGSRSGVQLGGSLGVAIRAGTTTWVMPEFALSGFLFGDGSYAYQRYLLQAGVSVLIGIPPSAPAPAAARE